SGGMTTDSDVVGWLPLYHDMGLVGILLGPLLTGADVILLRPDTFLARPETWLRAISDAPGDVMNSAPNFAYRHCVESIPEERVAELDLGRWRVAGCGAERVREETLRAFAERFAPAGFRASSFVPCYGMAEATLAVTFDASGREPRVVRGHVSCGRPLPDTEVVVRAVTTSGAEASGAAK